MDKILVRGLKIFAYHGVNAEEKIDGQNFIFDIDAFVDISVPCVSDNVDDTVSYAKIIKETTRIFSLCKCNRSYYRIRKGPKNRRNNCWYSC